MLKTTAAARAAATAAAAALALTGCSTASADSIEVTDPWVRAEAGDMTAMFGELTNNTDEDLLIESIETDVASIVEMHEMVENDQGTMIMQEVPGGFTLPAGDSLVLEPGGDHFMFMGLGQELAAGEIVTVTVHFADGDDLVIEATVKDFTGGNEPYGEDHGDDHEEGDH